MWTRTRCGRVTSSGTRTRSQLVEAPLHDRITDLIDQHEPDLLYSTARSPSRTRLLRGLPPLQHERPTKRGKVDAVYCSKRDRDSQQGLCVLDRERGVLDDILPRPWQTDTCIGEWHYKRGTRYKTPRWWSTCWWTS